MKITLRRQRISDAKSFYKILNNPNFVFFCLGPKTLEEEIDFLRKNKEKMEKNIQHNFTVLCDGVVVGACGIKVDQHRKFVGEIGYFIDEDHWNKGIATKSVKLLEKIAKRIGIKRLVILVNPKNIPSIQVAVKAGYKKEGKLKKALHIREKYTDAYLFAKTFV